MNALRLLSRNVHQAARLNVQGKPEAICSRLTQRSGGKTHDASDDSFSNLVGAKEPVVVDFHAEPCHMLDPVIRKAVEESGAVTLIRVNVDDCPNVSAKFQIASIPCVMAFKNGQPVDKFVGALPPTAVKQFVEKHAARA